ncbi:MAG: sigma-54-dependent Fis family transcriptional regulator [Deltaproteobacteria bacterium]|nr:sigma-54-dependent Fis family transcriptional regulator [Deltaproteobacteria bacterium]
MSAPNEAGPRPRVLVVDDQAAFRRLLTRILAEENYSVEEAPDAATALVLARKRPFHLVLTDIRMPGMDGHSLLAKLRQEMPETQVVLLTAFGTVPEAVAALKQGAFDSLTKPLADPDELKVVVERALRHRRMLDAEEARQSEGEVELVWADPLMRPLVESLKRVAPTSATVLLTGESGTGKEVVARALHALSPRKTHAFVAVNCAALSESLLDSELFGHERGAFTGADKQRRGRFELADGGTLLLDEVGEMSPALQAKLLRVLQERQVVRVGGTATLDVDVRVIAATHRDLRAAVATGGFREDLFYRLAVVPLHLPPLRERRLDIPALAQHFLHQLGRRHARGKVTLTAEAMAALQAQTWPGNVRELYNCIERAVVLGSSPHIAASDLEVAAPKPVPSEQSVNLAELERDAIARALEQCGGNRRLAADLLGISLRTLQYKLKEMGTP